MSIKKEFSPLYLQESEVEQFETILRVRKNSEFLSAQVPYNLLLECEDEARGILVAQTLYKIFDKEQCGYKNIKVITQEELFKLKWTSMTPSTFLIITKVDLTHPKWEELVLPFQETASMMKVVISKPVASSTFFFEQILNKHITIQNMEEEDIFLAYKEMVREEGIPVSAMFHNRMKYFIQYNYRNSPLKNFSYIDFLKNKIYQEIFTQPLDELRQQAKSKENTTVVQSVLDRMDLDMKPRETTRVLEKIKTMVGLSAVKQMMENMDQILTFDILHRTQTPVMFHKVFIGESYMGRKQISALYAQYLYAFHIVSSPDIAICEQDDVFSFIQENEGKVLVLEAIGQGNEIVSYLETLEKKTVAIFLTNQNYDYSFGQSVLFEPLTSEEWIQNFNSCVKEAGYSTNPDAINKVKDTIDLMVSQKQFKNWKTIQDLCKEMCENCALENKGTELQASHLTTVIEKKPQLSGPFNQNIKKKKKH